MPQWIREPARRHVALLYHSFTYLDEPGSGYLFDVDEQGTPKLESEAARENHRKALAAVEAGTMTDDGVIDLGREHFDPGAIRCSCGRTVELDTDWRGTRCECGQEYSSTGQLLRANWREVCRETGELSDDDFLS